MLKMSVKLFLLSFCFVVASVAKPEYGGTLVFGRGGDASILDPAHATDGETFYATASLYDKLVKFKYGTIEVEPALAKSWSISKDGLTYTFYLRENVMFAPQKYFKQKSEFTADDVLFSFNRQHDSKNPYFKVGGAYEYWQSMDMNNIIKDIQKIDKYTVKIILNKPEASFLRIVAMDFMSILSNDYANYLIKQNKKDNILIYPIGTGSFSFIDWIRDDRIILKANENYWDGKPYVDMLILKTIPNNSVRAAALKTKSIQIMDFPNPEELPQLKKDPDIKVAEQSGMNVGYLAMNTEKKPFTDVRVRQAINYAINKKDIVKSIYAGLGVIAKEPIPNTMLGYNDDIKGYPYNPSKAKQLLNEAGYPNGFETTIWAMPVPRPYMPNARRVAEVIQANLKSVGISAKIVTYDWATYLVKTKNGEHDMALMGWTGDNGDTDNFLYTLLSKQAAKKPAQNIAFWENDKFDELISKAKITIDSAQRAKLYKEAIVIFNDQAPWVPIAHSIVAVPMLKEVQNFKINPTGTREFNKVWLEKKSEK